MGLHRAGFDVTGVDIAPQPRYPFRFVQADALQTPFQLCDFDFIWASPPCQAFTVASQVHRKNGKVYPNLIPQTRSILQASGKLYVIENVLGSPVRCDVMLCGSMFGLGVVRHRIFETNFPGLIMVRPCQHPEIPVTVCGDGTPSWVRKRLIAKGRKSFTSEENRNAMGIDWTNRKELSQAIPPAYSEFLARNIFFDCENQPKSLR